MLLTPHICLVQRVFVGSLFIAPSYLGSCSLFFIRLMYVLSEFIRYSTANFGFLLASIKWAGSCLFKKKCEDFYIRIMWIRLSVSTKGWDKFCVSCVIYNILFERQVLENVSSNNRSVWR